MGKRITNRQAMDAADQFDLDPVGDDEHRAWLVARLAPCSAPYAAMLVTEASVELDAEFNGRYTAWDVVVRACERA
jgi:hypothetical protein